MREDRPFARVEAEARALCAAEGWDPDERIDCEPGEVVLAERSDEAGRWSCARWQAYVPAAERRLAAADEWESF